MTYSAWETPFGISFGADALPPEECSRPDAPPGDGPRLLYRFEAGSWEEAMAEHHRRQGWEEYRPWR